MSTPFDPPAQPIASDESPALDSPLHDPHVVIVAALLLLYGLPTCALASLFPVVGFVGGLFDPEFQDIPGGFLITGAIGTLEGVCIGALGLIYVVGGAGLLTGKKWGWIAGLAAGGMLLANLCCMPVGAYALYALLRTRVREAYGFN